jgi:hypothetical protein
MPVYELLDVDSRADNFPVFNQRFQELLYDVHRDINLRLGPINAELVALRRYLCAI